MKKEHINEIKGVIVLALGLILLASLISFVPDDLPWYTSQPNFPAKNLIRIVGAYSAGSLLFVFGYSSYFLVVFMFFWSWNKFISRQLYFTFSKFISLIILFCVLSALFSMTGPIEMTSRFGRGGLVGYVCAEFLIHYLGRTGAYIILGTLGTLTLIVTGEVLVSPFLFKLTAFIQELFENGRERLTEGREGNRAPKIKFKQPLTKAKEPAKTFSDRPENRILIEKEVNKLKELTKKILPSAPAAKTPASAASATPTVAKAPEKPQIRITGPTKEEQAPVREIEPKVVGNYTVPALDLLNDPPAISQGKLQSDLEQGATILEETLADFGVTVRVADIERGPVITRYELEPAPGVKVQKITTLSDDIALAMKAQTVRIVAPIPGKNRVGIEVPNSSIASVYLKDVLSQSQFSSSGSKLMLAIGKDISGKPLIANLAEMPHLLIAGTTGAGKTVCVNSIIMSMLFNASPDEVKFLMVDPKMVELAQYNNIPHMLCPAVTDYKKVSNALNWIVSEMESRYGLLSRAGVRNIAGYQAKGHQMPYIVVIIDELADLMQVAAKTIESAITRLAQLSRAVGIHLILATQRPSVDVITGVIKANFPARISFKVASKVDSRTVLDMNGAENLLGKGDLLFMKPGDAKPTRGQCSYVTDQEIDRVIQFIKKQQEPAYDEAILKQQTSSSASGSDEKDELYDEALKLVLETNQASVSILQRRMRLGYTRAARLIDMMEQNGIVGPYCGSKPRDILINREEWLLQNMKGAEPKNDATA
jgi:S-DNA-T family DNA segregation ATPase FtsK/SpoIIIE